MTGAVSTNRAPGWRMTRSPFGRLAMRWRRPVRLAPLVSTPTINLSAAVAACVASVGPMREDDDEVTVVERRRSGGAR